MKLKEEILDILNEMPRSYSYPPNATPEQKKAIKAKVGANVSDTLKRLDAFDKKVRDLLEVFDAELKAESDKIRDEDTARFGPFQSLARIRSKIESILVDIHKAKTKTVNSRN